jgi:hypothetical protein
MRDRHRFAVVAAWPVAALLALVSVGGLVSPAYARETGAWAAQAIGQDWFDLVVAVPVLATCGFCARAGSYRWSVLLAGAYAYTAYELCIYAFAVHFNALFLIYCAALGLAGYALVALAIDLAARTVPVDRRAARTGGAFLIGVGVAFALLWLGEDVPAVLHDEPPRSLAETGLLTNPVHVIDLAFVLPAHVVAGLWLWRGRRAGELLGAIVLAFGVLMAASIGGMMVVIAATGAPAAAPVIAAMFVVSAAAGLVLARVLREGRGRCVDARPSATGS